MQNLKKKMFQAVCVPSKSIQAKSKAVGPMKVNIKFELHVCICYLYCLSRQVKAKRMNNKNKTGSNFKNKMA